MLSPKNRLRLDSDFKRVKDKGKLFQSNTFAIAVFERDDTDDPRFGFVVSTKISKSAVARNGIKRGLRAAVAELVTNVKRGVDIVFLVKSSILQESRENLLKEVERSMKSAKLL